MNTSFKRYSIAAELLTSVVYQPYMPTEIQPGYKTLIFDPFAASCMALIPPLILFRPSHSLWMMRVGLFIKNGIFGLQSAKIAENIFINNLKTAFCRCHCFSSLPSGLNGYFPLVQNLYRFDSVGFMKVLWLSMLDYI